MLTPIRPDQSCLIMLAQRWWASDMCSFNVRWPPLGTANMVCVMLVVVEDLDSPIGEPDISPTADQSVRPRVKATVDFDVIVGM